MGSARPSSHSGASPGLAFLALRVCGVAVPLPTHQEYEELAARPGCAAMDSPTPRQLDLAQTAALMSARPGQWPG